MVFQFHCCILPKWTCVQIISTVVINSPLKHEEEFGNSHAVKRYSAQDSGQQLPSKYCLPCLLLNLLINLKFFPETKLNQFQKWNRFLRDIIYFFPSLPWIKTPSRGHISLSILWLPTMSILKKPNYHWKEGWRNQNTCEFFHYGGKNQVRYCHCSFLSFCVLSERLENSDFGS